MSFKLKFRSQITQGLILLMVFVSNRSAVFALPIDLVPVSGSLPVHSLLSPISPGIVQVSGSEVAGGIPLVDQPCIAPANLPSDACAANLLCTQLMSAIDQSMVVADGAGLTCGQIIDHVANRLGYGYSPIDSVKPKSATYANVRALVLKMAHAIQGDEPLIQSSQLQSTMAALYPNQQLTPAELTALFKTLATDSSTGAALLLTMTPQSEAYCLENPNQAYCAALTAYKTAHGGVCELTCSDQVSKTMSSEKVLRAALGSQYYDNGVLHDGQENLNEVLLEFWFNHFNIDNMKAGAYAQGTTSYEKTIFSKQYSTFKDLLIAVETHPAMLFYLDNETNAYTPSTQSPGNQNLGRELLELHTIGRGPAVEGYNSPYTQNDVVNSALILSGMKSTFGYPQYGAYFDATMHQPASLLVNKQVVNLAPPVVMGKTYDFNLTDYGTGQPGRNFLPVTNNGQLTAFLTDLANHPYTKLNLCRQLSGFFIRNQNFLLANEKLCLGAYGVDGNLPAMYTAIFTDPNFWSPGNYRSGTQNPLELAVSMVRKEGVRLSDLALPSYEVISTGVNAGKVTTNSFASVLASRILGGASSLGLSVRTYTYPTGYPLDGLTWLSKGFLNGAALTSFNEMNFHLSYSSAAQGQIVRSLASVTSSQSNLEQVLNLAWGYSSSVSFSSAQVNACSMLTSTSTEIDADNLSDTSKRLMDLQTTSEFLAASSFGIEK
jgi:hypothetical protein